MSAIRDIDAPSSRRIAFVSVTLLAALYAFYQEHERCDDLDSAVGRDRVWMACTCGAGTSQIREPYRPTLAARCLPYGLPECSKGGLGLAHQIVRFAPR